MHKRFQGRNTAGIALLFEARQHRFTIVEVILGNPLANLGLVGVQDRATLRARHRLRLASQVAAHRVASDAQHTGNFPNRFPLHLHFAYGMNGSTPYHGPSSSCRLMNTRIGPAKGWVNSSSAFLGQLYVGRNTSEKLLQKTRKIAILMAVEAAYYSF